jgi:beta-glucanase (GH16 family)
MPATATPAMPPPATPTHATPTHDTPTAGGNTGKPASDGFILDFSGGSQAATLSISDFDVDADWILMRFRRENVRHDDRGMTLIARKQGDAPMPYTTGEFQRKGFYGYGRYEAVMRPSDAHGVVSSFFIHTNEWFGDPHSEIDFEFVGKAPNKVHINYFNEGRDDPLEVDLWFKPSEAEHLYAFEWTPGSITWFIDGVIVRKVTASETSIGIPSRTSRFMGNIWTGNRQGEAWIGAPDFEATSASYRCISHVPVGKPGPQCSDMYPPPNR